MERLQRIWRVSFGYLIPVFSGTMIVSLSISEYIPVWAKRRVIQMSDSEIISIMSAPPIPELKDLPGTAFMQEVWKKLLEIPWGETCSYSDIAIRIGRPKAVRAVGTAIGRNPIALLIPCHRVLAKDGSIGGFSYGVRIKRRMLIWEKEIREKIEK
ncbi:MAG: methylated-DNA--[protein]-cysteine S-methyltransferase [Porphyromonas sp.]|nr:methylated-DNA--[protein]-cysteine S-methyltransferase [Porphyromonas sp.]